MSDKQGKCETCRWWDEPRKPSAVAIQYGSEFHRVDLPGTPHGKCNWMPQTIEKDANDRCGQWRERA